MDESRSPGAVPTSGTSVSPRTASLPHQRILVLGATGYVGGRLVPRLLDSGYLVRCLVRSPDKLRGMAWADDVEVVRGDLLGPEDLPAAFADVGAVFHLVHSMGSATSFVDADRRIARAVAQAAAEAGVERIVYLSGLGELDEHSSAHLRSRAEVGEVLLAGPVPTTVLRAAVIIGSGSASFEMLRHLVERLPVMVTPRWVNTRIQPIAIRDVLRYLIAVLSATDGRNHVYDIGGPDVLSYLEMMQRYAAIAGLPRRLVLRVPVLTPKLSSHWVGFVTPVPVGLAKPLVESLRQEVVVGTGGEDVTDVAPGPTIPYERALRLALDRIRDHEVETSWRDAELADRSPADPYPGDPAWAGGTLLTDARSARAESPAHDVFRVVCGIGGERGWPTHGWAWKVRGWIDHLVGGVGLRRGRRDPDALRVGDALDFWRVEDVRPPRTDHDPHAAQGVLRLRAEMRLPGRAWLEFRVLPVGGPSGEGAPGPDALLDPRTGAATLHQRALFAPKGLLGRCYWWAMLPFHALIFSAMVQRLAREAEILTSSGARTTRGAAPDAAAAGGSPARRHDRSA
jgi:uncharacterized protein YbjT (DUF2867 family)